MLYCALTNKRVDFVLHVLTKTSKSKHRRGTGKPSEVMDVSLILTVVMALWVNASVQMHQIVHIKYVYFLNLSLISQGCLIVFN